MVSLNESGHSTTPTTTAYESFYFSLWLSVSPSHYFVLLLSLSLSHTHNHAVQMNAHTNVTDCETVTHTQQRLGKKDALSPLSLLVKSLAFSRILPRSASESRREWECCNCMLDD